MKDCCSSSLSNKDKCKEKVMVKYFPFPENILKRDVKN